METRVDLETAYRHCQDLTRREAKNFYFGFISLPRFRRRAICAMYALSRRWDDIADEDRPPEKKSRLLDEEERKLENLTANLDDPVFRAVHHVISEFQIPFHYFHDLLEGFRLDLVKTRYERFRELIEYCYHVASIPGLIVLEVFGYEKEEARTYARKLGYAMQLTNILRDVTNDLERNRIYIPGEMLRREGVTEADLKRGEWSPSLERALRRLGTYAERYFQEAKNLFPLIAPSSRTCPLILMRLYRTLLRRLKAKRFDVFSSPVELNLIDKCYILFNTVFFHPSAV